MKAKAHEECGGISQVCVNLKDEVWIGRVVQAEQARTKVTVDRVLKVKGRRQHHSAFPSCAHVQAFSTPESASDPVPFPRWTRLSVAALTTCFLVAGVPFTDALYPVIAYPG